MTPFALPTSPTGVPIDPGPPPRLGEATDQAYKDAAVEIIRRSSELDATDGVAIDVGPGAFGGNTLGADDGVGHPVNPATGQPYAPHPVPRADFARVLAEYWADGPKSETPPGHWNVIANQVSDTPGFEPRIGGAGDPVDRLEWDVKLYLALNGAVARRGDRDLGRQGLLRLRPSDLDDPLPGRARASRAIRPVRRTPPRGCPSCRTWSR